MWEVKREVLTFELPEGFSLREDLDFLYLYFREELIAKFPIATATPLAIIREIEKKRGSLK